MGKFSIRQFSEHVVTDGFTGVAPGGAGICKPPGQAVIALIFFTEHDCLGDVGPGI